MKKKKWYLLIVVGALFFLAGCIDKKIVEKERHQVSKTSSISEASQRLSVPTLFVHGYGGGKNSFGRMIQRLDDEGLTTKKLVLTVNAVGEVHAKGQLTGKEDNPSIQVLFEDNKSHEWNQAEWIKNCLQYLRDTYGLTEINFVGHSMGGASSLRYLTTFGDDVSLPKIKKFVGIAVPFNNFVELSNGEKINDIIAKGPVVQSERLTDYINGIVKVPKDMNVMIIAGDVEDGSLSDEAVPVADALSVVSLFMTHGNEVQEKIIYGKSAQHSQLHENKDVDQLVADFLWK